MDKVSLLINGGSVITPQSRLEGGWVAIRDSRIAAVGTSHQPFPTAEFTINARGLLVSPGFIDLHCHGGAGSDVMDATLEDICIMAAFHCSGGTTSFLPTTASSSLEDLFKALQNLREARKKVTGSADILGAHIEGPYFCQQFRGCHLPEFVRNPRPEEYSRILEYVDVIKSITLSPELEGAVDLIHSLREQGVVASAGHSAATYDQIITAIDAGMTHTTHAYCAMSTITKKGPFRDLGLIETMLVRDELTTEIIADGFHLPGPLMEMIVKCKGTEKVALVTDAMRGAGMPDGNYTFGGKDGLLATVKDGVAVMPDNTGFASSTARMNRLVRNAIEIIGLTPLQAISMASLVPARIAGVDRFKGSLQGGKDADIVLLSPDFDVQSVFVRGKKVFGLEP